jgi:hypothetical protein
MSVCMMVWAATLWWVVQHEGCVLLVDLLGVTVGVACWYDWGPDCWVSSLFGGLCCECLWTNLGYLLRPRVLVNLFGVFVADAC